MVAGCEDSEVAAVVCLGYPLKVRLSFKVSFLRCPLTRYISLIVSVFTFRELMALFVIKPYWSFKPRSCLFRYVWTFLKLISLEVLV